MPEVAAGSGPLWQNLESLVSVLDSDTGRFGCIEIGYVVDVVEDTDAVEGRAQWDFVEVVVDSHIDLVEDSLVVNDKIVDSAAYHHRAPSVWNGEQCLQPRRDQGRHTR